MQENGTMNEIKCLEHPTLKIPYEVFNKKYRGAQRVLDMESRQTAAVASEITTAIEKDCKAGDINMLLGGMVEKLKTMKRKASEAVSEEIQAACICKRRLEHIKEHATAANDVNATEAQEKKGSNQSLKKKLKYLGHTEYKGHKRKAMLSPWRKIRLDRMLVDYFLRNGYYDAANKLADSSEIRDLTNVDIYAIAAHVESELRAHRTARSLEWCSDNRSKLRKLSSNMEFKIRIQEFIELVREDKRLEAVMYAKKHFSTYEEDQLLEIQQCMGMLAFPKDTQVEPYRSLLDDSRWEALIRQFRFEHSRLLHPAKVSALPVTLQLGLAALNTPQCHGGVRTPSCPACQPPLNNLARSLPHAHASHSRLVCRISRKVINEHNLPLALPNGQVYGELGLKEMMKESGAIICPKTKEVYCMKRVEKVYVM